MSEATTPEPKKWTLMFYMASDNPLVISIVSQLKAIKAAGYDPNVNVIAQFDPYAEGTPTHIFDVNLINKAKAKDKNPNIGFGGESDVRNLMEDKLWRHETGRNGDSLIRSAIKDVMASKQISYDPPIAPELNGTNGGPGTRRYEPDPYTSLHTFINFCCEKYPAEHYMLFILGHGVVVGNDIFLYDVHAEKHSITLKEMANCLSEFKEKIEEEQEPKGTFELVSFNSCSVSSLEVAYELKNTANYMLASQGPTFVGSWPYREILMRIFKDRKDVGTLISNIFDYCVQNSADFLLAGYSYQLTLCDLRTISDVSEPLGNLSKALIDGLKGPERDVVADVLVYAHWKSQSFFQEMYTDLYDFCECVIENPADTQSIQAIKSACVELTRTLAKPSGKGNRFNENRIVVAADFVGPAYQYSHGLSVYFPWTEPSEDSHILQQYKDYKLSEDLTDSWLDFLKVYFEETRRDPVLSAVKTLTAEQELQEDMASHVYRGEGQLGGFALNKSDPKDKTGNDCECPPFKNYPRDTRARKERRAQAQGIPLGETVTSAA